VILLAWAIASGLQELHQAGVVYNDLKPLNCLLDGEGAVLADLGMLKTIDSGEQYSTIMPVAGTLYFM